MLNASPVVPCFHGGCFRYKTVAVYDDVDENIAQHFLDTNAFIDQVWALSPVSPTHRLIAPIRCAPPCRVTVSAAQGGT